MNFHKRKHFRRVTVDNFHWQWKVGKRCLVAYCDETGEKRYTENLAQFLNPGNKEYPWGWEFYSYVSPKCVVAWLRGEPIPLPEKIEHPMYCKTYEKITAGKAND